MAPKRRVSGPATKSSQSTLAFHGASNKVTKPSTHAPSGKKNVLAEVVKKQEEAKPEIIEIIDEPTTAEAALIDQTKEEVGEAQTAQSTPEEDEARRISEASINEYWAAKEKLRTAPRVHQSGLSLHEKVLREFDMSAQYGVSFQKSFIMCLIRNISSTCMHVHALTFLCLTALHWHCTLEAMEASIPNQS